MNTIEKAQEYTENHPKKYDDRLLWEDIREAYIQGHKDAYIESVHEQYFKTSEYMPPVEPGKKHNTIWVLSAGELVYYDYNEEMWYNEHGMPTHVEIWTWPEAVPVEAEPVEPEDTDRRITELITKIHQVESVFEELLDSQITINELKDFWRNRAGLIQKCEE